MKGFFKLEERLKKKRFLKLRKNVAKAAIQFGGQITYIRPEFYRCEQEAAPRILFFYNEHTLLQFLHKNAGDEDTVRKIWELTWEKEIKLSPQIEGRRPRYD